MLSENTASSEENNFNSVDRSRIKDQIWYKLVKADHTLVVKSEKDQRTERIRKER